jgi:hypothetical protein
MQTSLNQKQLNSINALANFNAIEYIDSTLRYSLERLSECARLHTVTAIEYQIMRLKEGELHDRTLIEGAIKQLQEANSVSTANIKRENKAYSYKEQLAELELRKELEAKKQNNSDQASAKQKKSPQEYTLTQLRAHMSKKQQELLDQQIQRESKIRDELKQLDNLINKSTSILIHLLDGNKYELKCHLMSIMRVYLPIMRTPMCAHYALKLFLSIAEKLFTDRHLTFSKFSRAHFAASIVYSLFRLCSAPVEIEKCWLDEPLQQACIRLVKEIDSSIQAEISYECFDIAKACFIYPFLKVSSFFFLVLFLFLFFFNLYFVLILFYSLF